MRRSAKSRLLAWLTALSACVGIATPALAEPFIGTPSPSLFPRFGTLITFDDLPTGVLLPPDWYSALGVRSIANVDMTGHPLRTFTSTQSLPNYVGTGPAAGWDATILISLARPAHMIGIGVANGIGLDTLTAFDSQMRWLEEMNVPEGGNSYAGFRRGESGISFLRITCDFCAIDDLQFGDMSPVPEPSTMLLFATGTMALVTRIRSRRRS